MNKVKVKLKLWYLDFLEKKKRNFFENIFYFFLYLLSFLYGAVVYARNILYEKGILRLHSCSAGVIGVGNISWSGSGKTSLTLWLYNKFSPYLKVAILRRGYGLDEGKLLKEVTSSVFSSPDRYSLTKKLGTSFQLFILDDAFQYQRLIKDVNIVIMGAREFKKKHRLIPACFFREPLSSLKRADIVVLHYQDEMDNPSVFKNKVLSYKDTLEVFFSNYKFKEFCDLQDKKIPIDYFKDKRIAALSAIGYPRGFFNKLYQLNLDIASEIIFPDHYELTKKEFSGIQRDLLGKGIKDLIITHKDKYHLPYDADMKINVYVMKVSFCIEDEESFMRAIKNKLNLNRNT